MIISHTFSGQLFQKGSGFDLLNTVELKPGKSCFPDDSALHGLQELKASGNAATR